MWERTHKIAILKQLQTHFKAKSEEDVKTPFPPPTTPLQVIIAHPKLSLDKVTTKVLDTP